MKVKSRIPRIISFCLALCIVASSNVTFLKNVDSAISATAESLADVFDYYISDSYYVSLAGDSQCAVITGLNAQNVKDLVIPGTIDGYPVVVGDDTHLTNTESICSLTIEEGAWFIGDGAFYGCSKLESVNLADSIMTIGDYAFKDCISLEDIDLPENLIGIGADVFSNCSIKRIGIGASLKNISGLPLWDDQLEKIEVADGNKSFSSLDGVLLDNAKTNVLLCPRSWSGDFVVPSTVKSITSEAFQGCTGLGAIEFSEGLEKIDKNAFRGCSEIETLTFPASLTSIGEYAFSGCTSLSDITIDESNCSIEQYAFESCGLNTAFIGAASIEKFAFFNCQSLQSVNFSSSLEKFDNYAFDGCKSLESYNVPASNEKYQSSAGVLYSNGSLIAYPAGKRDKYFTVSENAETIVEHSFVANPYLMVAEIPENVVSIEDEAFYRCENLTIAGIYNADCEMGSVSTSQKCFNFSGSENLVLYAHQDSTAEEYANKHSVSYVSIEKPLTYTGAIFITATDEFDMSSAMFNPPTDGTIWYAPISFLELQKLQGGEMPIYEEFEIGETKIRKITGIVGSGDINGDGDFSVADVVLLQKWLLAVPDTKLSNWKAADLCEDDVLNVFDLCLMKRKLLNESKK